MFKNIFVKAAFYLFLTFENYTKILIMRGIIPKKIKGFRDIDADLNQLKWKIIDAAKQVYKSYGFEHWDTPVLEYADCLGKYLPDADAVAEGVYSFKNPELEPVYKSNGEELRDEWNRVVMDNHHLTMRYDLTAPLARVYAESLFASFLKNGVNEANAPIFRRYQFGPVYRFEEKLDPGRYREFWQLDFDSVGVKDVTADAEVCMILSDALEAIGLERSSYLVKVNDRKILKGLLGSLGFENEEMEQNILRIIDKADKIGAKGVELELGNGRTDATSGAKIEGLKIDVTKISEIVGFLESFALPVSRNEVLKLLMSKPIENSIYSEGLDELTKINTVLEALGFDEQRIIFDPTLVRGMAYYTGPIFEVVSTQSYIDEKGRERKIGSICGGGRYDGLVEKLLGLRVPATGASIGVDRLAELLTLTKRVPEKADGPVLIIVFDEHLMPEYQKIARELRLAGIATEVYYGSQRGLKKQLAYSDKKNCPVAILMGEDEVNKGVVTVRNLKLGKQMASQITDKTEWKDKVQMEVNREDLIQEIQKLLK